MYAKLIDGSIEYAKHYITHGDKTIINPSGAILLEHGFKELVVEDMPELLEGQAIEPYYEETETAITQKWRIVEIVETEV